MNVSDAGMSGVLSPIEFLAEPRYEHLVVNAPNEIEQRWHCDLRVGGNLFSGYGENGYQAFIAALRRYRETDPDTGIATLTINADRGQHRKEPELPLDYQQ